MGTLDQRGSALSLTRFSLLFALTACAAASPASPLAPASAASPAATGASIAAPPAPVADEEDLKIPIGATDVAIGPRQAYVTLVVFTDLQCPFCARFALAVERLREETDPSALRVVFKHQPLSFHAHAEAAAEVGQGVFETRGSDAFLRYQDLAFRRQQQMNADAVVAWASAAGADPKEIQAGLDQGRWRGKVEADQRLGATIGAEGTPTTFVNGVRMGGAQPYEKLKALVDAELEKAKALEASGVARDKLYRVAVAENFRAAPPPSDEPREDTKTVWRVPVGTSPMLGSAAALVTIVEFSDFQCPYCKKVEITLDKIRKDYGDKVRIVWKDAPLSFHPRAEPAAELARAARAQRGNAGFWAVHDRLFASQPKLEDADLEGVARASQLDVKRAMKDVSAKSHAAGIEADRALMDEVAAQGTPHFFINGRRLVGAQGPEKFKAIIDEEIAKASQLVAKGIAASSVYDELQKSAKAATGDVVIQDLQAGTGRPARRGDTLTVHYTGTFEDGAIFDSSREHPTPFSFELGKGHVIKGWERGVVGMKVGGRRRLVVPPDLAYGSRGAPPAIPPGATLVFEIELLALR